VRLVNLKSDDRLVALDVVCESDLERYALSEGEAGEAGASAEEWPATEPEPGEEGEA
jgi:hypothetical protein